ncbi:hypothetical protein CVT25_002405 [Psilocybe cyanescens]|uniref:Uncharacterized protein n=1 Tax=Psilocybe cyanescens TaxID=93625 RepID=A0A409WK85_PSICY|nr:hypothetical protein CVT25_002405 [Psilocybe cyanescens]
MVSSSSRQSSNKSKHSVFVPSPRFLSESPAKNRSPGHIDYPGQASFSDQSQGPSNARNLKSPIPPPPANLYPGSPAAFNVDPGAPFLAPAALTDDNHSDSGSIRDDPGPKGFTGAFVSGIKNVVKRSLRDRSRSQYQQNQRQNQQESQDVYDITPQFRDSGYATSLPIPPSGLPPMPENLSTPASSIHTVYSAHAPSETLLGHAEERYDRDDATVIGHSNSMTKQKMKPVNKEYGYDARYDQQSPPTPAQQYQHQVTNSFHEPPAPMPVQPITHRRPPRQTTYSEIIGPEDIASPVSAHLQYGPNYMQMNLVTPPPSETSLNTYLKRLQKFASDVNALPWVAKERPTKDYYPERSRRSDEPKKAPAIVWRSEAFVKADEYHAEEEEGSVDDASFSEWSPIGGSFKDGSVKMGPGMHAPRRGSRSAMDLDAEFEGSRTPMPTNPPNMTPYIHPRGVQLTDNPMPRPSQPSDSVLFQSGPPPDIPIPVRPPPLDPPSDNRGDYYVRSLPSNPPPTNRPPMAQTPIFYVPPSAPPSAGAGAEHTPRDQRIYSTGQAPPPPPPPGFADQNPNNWYPTQATPNTYTRSALDRIVPTAEFPYLGPNPNPDWGGGQATPSFRAPAAPRGQEHSSSPSPVIPSSRIPRSAPAPHPATPRAPPPFTPRSEWEQYPSNDGTGYVPSQYAEHFYGDQYGPGVHAARPPLVPPPFTASAASGQSSRRSSAAPSATSRRSRA